MNIQILTEYYDGLNGENINFMYQYYTTDNFFRNQHGWYREYDMQGNLIYFDFMQHNEFVGIRWDDTQYLSYTRQPIISFYLM